MHIQPIAAKLGLLSATVAALLSVAGCGSLLNPRFGNFGGDNRHEAPPPFSVEQTARDGVRWYPRQVRYSPDGTNILVSLCHTQAPRFCRIGRYYLTDKRWEVFPYDDAHSYQFPTYTPDGKWIAFSNHNLATNTTTLDRMAFDGGQHEPVIASKTYGMSFSADGSKAIYYCNPYPRLGYYEICLLDWNTRAERKLTNLGLYQDETAGRPFLVDDDTAFVFAGRVNWQGWEKKFGFLKVRLDARPIDKDSGASRATQVSKGANPFDMTSSGELLHVSSSIQKSRAGEPLAVALDPTGWRTGTVLFLRPLRLDARDTGAFGAWCEVLGCADAAISPDQQQVTFVDGQLDYYVHRHPRHGELGIARRNEVEPTYLDWPKFDLAPLVLKQGR